MKRIKQNRKSDIIIDLTSLLDVIFIVLLVVMVGQKYTITNKQNDLKEEMERYEAAISEYNNSQALYDDAVNTARYFKSVSVTVPYDHDEVHKREIHLLFLGEGEQEPIELIGNEVDNSIQEFKDRLEQYIFENSDTPIVLSLNDNDDTILFRDEKMITEVFNELSSKYDNVYIKENLSEDK